MSHNRWAMCLPGARAAALRGVAAYMAPLDVGSRSA